MAPEILKKVYLERTQELINPLYLNMKIILLDICAWIVIGNSLFIVIFGPSLFGKDRGTYDMKWWIGVCLAEGITIPLALKVLGYL